MARIFSRILDPPKKTFLLVGPRGTGKSTWLAKHFPRAVRIDLLHTEQLYRYRSNPSLLRSDLSGLRAGEWAVIDEAQKVPDLLDEIHGLYEARRINFAITGSRARKLRRADVNLLGGRAIRCDFFPLGLGRDQAGLVSRRVSRLREASSRGYGPVACDRHAGELRGHLSSGGDRGGGTDPQYPAVRGFSR